MADKTTNSVPSTGYTMPQDKLDVQTCVKPIPFVSKELSKTVYLNGIVADLGKIRMMTGFAQFSVQVMVSFKVLQPDGKYQSLRYNYYDIQ